MKNKNVRRLTMQAVAHIWKAIPKFDPSSVKEGRWLIDSFLAEGSIQLIYGEHGSFKSTCLLAAARAVSDGEAFLGMETRQRVVLYLDYENPPDVIKSRNQDMKLGLPGRRFVIWDRFTGKQTPTPDDPALEQFVKICVKKTGKGPWLIFDSWSSLLKAGEGGETTGQVAPVYAAIRRLCDVGATCSMIDHSRKYQPNVLYGGADKMTKVDTLHNFVVHKSPESPRPSRFREVVVRVDSWLKRYSPRGQGVFSFEVRSEKDAKGRWHITDLRPAKDPIEVKKNRRIGILRDLIREHPGLGQTALANLAADTNAMGQNVAMELLRKGIGRYWSASPARGRKLVFKVLKPVKSQESENKREKAANLKKLKK
ncbi:MAG TPA: AAA family ATPase [Candidatus Acidoferrales bacterium]|nr:AAA family ATPase [Candidatus Acidoferrales bacterium]